MRSLAEEEDLAVETGQGHGHDRGGVTLGKYNVGIFLNQGLVKGYKKPGGQGGQGLVGAHI